jgi:AAA+ ATPase superfamily predicted ATPase
MKKDKLKFRKRAAFINRQRELRELRTYIDEEPQSILFLHGPKSSGKTTLLYRLFDQVEKEQKLDVKFINLRKTFTEFSGNYEYKDFLSVFFQVSDDENGNEKTEKLSGGINVGFFKIDAEIEKKMHKGRVDPFKVMEREFLLLRDKGIKPVLIIDELQALDKTYLDNGRERRLIIEVFNFFVAMTKESHLAHIIIASSDGYFLNTVYNDSKLKKTSKFYNVDYLCREDVMEWLLNLEKYSKITDYKLSEEDAEKIWNTVGGSMWEIQDILTDIFETPLDDVLNLYKKKITGIVDYYISGDTEKETVLKLFLEKDVAHIKDFIKKGIPASRASELLRDMVRNNILYFDPTEAIYYPQGKSSQWGIRLYFERLY